jgi:hypothetical protein
MNDGNIPKQPSITFQVHGEVLAVEERDGKLKPKRKAFHACSGYDYRKR